MGQHVMIPTGFRRLEAVAIPNLAPAPRQGAVSQLEWRPLDLLVVDETYQRSISSVTSRKNIKAIVEHFDWRKFSPVVISPVVGGLYAIVDGQHRATAALMCGHDQVPCMIVIADRQQQAEIFRAVSGQVTVVSQTQIFKAAIAAEDGEALRVKRVAGEAGVVVLTYHPSAALVKVNETAALRAVMAALSTYGDRTTRVALQALRTAAERSGDRQLNTMNIAVTTSILDERKEWRDRDDVDRIFAGFDFPGMMRDARLRHADRPQTKIAGHFRDVLMTALRRATAIG